ncbi:cupin domain-containing protein [Pelagibacterium lacus]|uniref:Cupin domain-containing protein n=1 Tax=Pelagibacterium lacus TaxID=2282655 RepID=A0A369W4J1_9HYPH|nr:cupin domain-containing protein [Pelagibacterium lacus]RDE09243.1 cupin domain-containing protein [Pelagibacterium lacus]
MTQAHYNPVLRLSDAALDRNADRGWFESYDAYVGNILQLTRLGCSYTEVAPGKTACPHHVHHGEDEMLVILSGEGDYRFGDKTYKVRGGDVLGAPVGGPAYAHQLINTGTETLKYLVFSSKADIDVCEYPDSGKFMVSSRPVQGTARHRLRYIGREETSLDYLDGENIGDET